MDEIEIDESLPGPLGCKYDDSLTELQIQLVVPGIKEKTFTHAANTDVYIKTDSDSVTLLLTVFKMNKKASPPEKITLDKRLFQVKKFPGKILSRVVGKRARYARSLGALFVSSAKRVPFASPLPTISYAFFSFSRMRLLGILNFVDVNVLLRSVS
ncbi:hypothetical protein QR680_014830 [Steinernema hermaphroditum]|uniref:Uncharacterized protein n=1 Tax=Steinernema hermaphroditum TaxID=289476 RepID=A0AA39M4Q1_9BILA|nr:hypothetical protein QR680_014830 [Steinernema hermaphroditum]